MRNCICQLVLTFCMLLVSCNSSTDEVDIKNTEVLATVSRISMFKADSRKFSPDYYPSVVLKDIEFVDKAGAVFPFDLIHVETLSVRLLRNNAADLYLNEFSGFEVGQTYIFKITYSKRHSNNNPFPVFDLKWLRAGPGADGD